MSLWRMGGLPPCRYAIAHSTSFMTVANVASFSPCKNTLNFCDHIRKPLSAHPHGPLGTYASKRHDMLQPRNESMD